MTNLINLVALLGALLLNTNCSVLNKELETMSDIQLSFEIERDTWISGESINFWVVLSNSGDQIIRIPDSFSSGFLHVSLVNLENDLTDTYTQGLPLQTRHPDRPRLDNIITETDLNPGEETKYFIDFNDYAPQLPKVGSYRMKVNLQTENLSLMSESIELEVEPLRPMHVNSITDWENKCLRQTNMHKSPKGCVLLVRESDARFPASIGYHRIAETLPDTADVSISLPLRPLLNNTTALVLSRNTLTVCMIEDDLNFERSVDIKEGTLFPFGWQIDDETSEFVMLSEEGGTVRAVIITVQNFEKERTKLDEIDLPLQGIPENWRLKRKAHKAHWTLVYSAGNELMKLDFTRTKVGKAELLIQENGTLAGFEMYPISAAPQEAIDALGENETNYVSVPPLDAVDAIFGPILENGAIRISLKRVDMTTGKVLSEIKLPFKNDLKGGDIDWKLSSAVGSEMYAVLREDDQLVGFGMEREILMDELNGASAITLDLFGNSYLLGWTSKEGNPEFRVID